MKNIIKALRQFPYNKGASLIMFCEYLILKMFTRASFSNMSIIPLVMGYYNLDSEEEFRVRYYVSRIGFDSIWSSKDRSTEEATEAFYNEHDADLWRQAYLARTRYIYKKKILLASHIAHAIKARQILDYGCGAGVLVHYLKRKGFVVDAADIPSPTLEFVKTMGLNSVLTITKDLQLQKEQYDLITCLDALEHTFTPLEITKRLLGSLKKGGILHVTFPREEGEGSHGGHHHQHTPEAQRERPAVFAYLRSTCDELVSESIYRKRVA